MKSSLFRDRPARKTRLAMMVSGAVLIHFGIVGVGAFWQQPVTERKDIGPTLVDVGEHGPASSDDVQYVTVANNAPNETPDSATPTPENVVQADPQLPVEVPVMAEPWDDAPPPKPKHMPSRSANTASAANLTHSTTGIPGARIGSPDGMTGVTGSGRAGVQTWKTPKPPYPRIVLASGSQGATTVRITTDANGSVATVEIVHSTGNALLDHNTQTYVRAFWKGPPNATRTTEFVYQIP